VAGRGGSRGPGPLPLIMGNPQTEVLGGLRALPAQLKFRAHLARCLLQKKKYPLLRLSAAKGGLIKTFRIQNDLKLKKVVRHGDRLLFSLALPFFPSEAFDLMTAKGGLNIAASGTPLKTQMEVIILAITQRCSLGCAHCYERFNLVNQDSVPVERWKDVVKDLQEMGVNVITFSGGEPMERYDALLELLESGDKGRSDFHLHTSGIGVSFEKAAELKKAGLAAVGVGLDDYDPDRHDLLRGRRGSHWEAVQALRFFAEAGVFTYINMCLTRELVRSDGLLPYMEMARDLGVGFVRWLEPRPCGGYFFQDQTDLFSEEDRRVATDFFLKMNTRRIFRDYPAISYLAFDESPEILGCQMGGLALFYIDGLGNVQPCVFLPVSFGNIQEEPFLDIVARMRKAVPFRLRQGCPASFFSRTIRAKSEQCGQYPVPISKIRVEWEEMFSPPPL
jgi:MoaA/NifB/PqqE/SkfB family radical SAM enzyme